MSTISDGEGETMARHLEDIQRDRIIVTADVAKLQHYQDVPGAPAALSRAQRRLDDIKAELQAAGWRPSQAADLAEIHVSLHPKGNP